MKFVLFASSFLAVGSLVMSACSDGPHSVGTNPGDLTSDDHSNGDGKQPAKDPAKDPPADGFVTTPPVCKAEFMTGGPSGECASNRDFLTKAHAICADDKRTVSDFKSDNACGPEFSRSVTYNCCISTPPPACKAEFMTGGPSGECASNRDFLSKAHEICANDDRNVSDFKSDNACGPEFSRSVTYNCCNAAPPTPPPACKAEFMAGGPSGECASNRDFLSKAHAICADDKRTLTDFKSDNACGPESSRSATFSCCH